MNPAATPEASVSRRLADFVHGVSCASLPAPVVDRAKTRILDCIATAIAARALPVPSVALRSIAGGSGPCTLIGQSATAGAADAAFVNATLVNGCSQDDFLEKSHPGALTVPGALAIGEIHGRTGAEVIAAVVAGYDVIGRVYLGGPEMLPRFRASGVAGSVGAAATAGKLLGLDVDALVHALGCGAMFSCGFGQGFLSGTMDVKLNVGMSSRNGVAAALLAQAGATASELAFEGPSGFYNAFSGGTGKVEPALRDLGRRFLIDDTVYKERPLCIFVQTPVALAVDLAARERIDPARIEKVTLTAPELTYTNPGFTNVAPFRTHLQAVVSSRFCVAAALLGRPVGEYAFYDSNREDAEVLALAARVELRRGEPEAGDRIELEVVHGGRTLAIRGMENETLKPAKDKIVAKFHRLAGGFLGSRTDPVLDMVMSLETLANVRMLTAKLKA